MSTSFHRYVALGDSFTEGVGDPDPDRPNGLRGWADRVAEVLARRAAQDGHDFGYANLAIRGRKLPAIVSEQVGAAVALEPDLITVYAGANDILRPKVDLDALAEVYDGAVASLASTGAEIVLFTAFDPGAGGIYGPVRGRFALYNEHVRGIADRHGARVADSWRVSQRLPDGVLAHDPRMWDVDRMHLGPAGHQVVAGMVLDVLGVEHDLAELDLPEAADFSRRERLRADATWAKAYLLPWIQRRVTGRSSGDGLDPKYPTLTRMPHLVG